MTEARVEGGNIVGECCPVAIGQGGQPRCTRHISQRGAGNLKGHQMQLHMLISS
jgi:hypothetical protein